MYDVHRTESVRSDFPSSLQRQAGEIERRRRLREQQEAFRRDGGVQQATAPGGGSGLRSRPPA